MVKGFAVFHHSQGIQAERGVWKTPNGTLQQEGEATRGFASHPRQKEQPWRADLLEKIALTGRLLVLYKTEYEQNCSKFNTRLLRKRFVEVKVTVTQN